MQNKKLPVSSLREGIERREANTVGPPGSVKDYRGHSGHTCIGESDTGKLSDTLYCGGLGTECAFTFFMKVDVDRNRSLGRLEKSRISIHRQKTKVFQFAGQPFFSCLRMLNGASAFFIAAVLKKFEKLCGGREKKSNFAVQT